jgi:hypothetical protein
MPAMTTSAGSTYRRWTRSSCGRRRGHEVAGLLDGPYANFFRDPSVRPFLEHFPERRETLPAVTLDQCSPCSGAYGALAVVCSTFCAPPQSAGSGHERTPTWSEAGVLPTHRVTIAREEANRGRTTSGYQRPSTVMEDFQLSLRAQLHGLQQILIETAPLRGSILWVGTARCSSGVDGGLSPMASVPAECRRR